MSKTAESGPSGQTVSSAKNRRVVPTLLGTYAVGSTEVSESSVVWRRHSSSHAPYSPRSCTT